MKKLLSLYKPEGIREFVLSIIPWCGFLITDLVIITLLYNWLHSSFGNLLSDTGRYRLWLPTLLSDLTVNYPGSTSTLFLVAALTVVMLLMLSLFFSGGIYGVIAKDEKFSLLKFLKKCAAYFGSMFRLGIAMLPVWLLLAALPGATFWLHYTSQKKSPSEWLVILFMFLWIPIAIFFWILAKSIFDYGRIHLVLKETGVIAALKEGIVTLWKNKLMTLLIFLVYLVFSILVIFLFSLPGKSMPVITIFLILQVSVLTRFYGKVLLMKAEVTLTGKEA